MSGWCGPGGSCVTGRCAQCRPLQAPFPSRWKGARSACHARDELDRNAEGPARDVETGLVPWRDRKSTRLNSSHMSISYAVFCLKKKKNTDFALSFKKKKKQKQTYS